MKKTSKQFPLRLGEVQRSIRIPQQHIGIQLTWRGSANPNADANRQLTARKRNGS
jgi:hypothetical protein